MNEYQTVGFLQITDYYHKIIAFYFILDSFEDSYNEFEFYFVEN